MGRITSLDLQSKQLNTGFQTANPRMLPTPILHIPQLRLPQFDLVPIGVDDPGEFAVFVGFGAFEDVDAVHAQVGEEGVHVIDAVVDHERGFAGCEPLGVGLGETPNREALVFGCV